MINKRDKWSLSSRELKEKLSRRAFLIGSAVGATGLVVPAHSLVSASSHTTSDNSCALDRELTEGPYYLDREIFRRDITEHHPGTPLQLRLTILDANTCKPIPNAALEIWHCNASGIYSGFTKMNPNSMGGGPPPGGRFPARPPSGPPPGPPPDFAEGSPHPAPGLGRQQEPDKTTFCRGIQLSSNQGIVEFTTIYPGWYVSRDTHIHLKVHVGGQANPQSYQGGHVSHTGQLFFPDDLSDEIAKLKPYLGHRVVRTRLDEDPIYGEAHASGPLLSFEPLKRGSMESGFIATATIRIDPSAVSHEHRPGGPPPWVGRG